MVAYGWQLWSTVTLRDRAVGGLGPPDSARLLYGLLYGRRYVETSDDPGR